MIPDLPEQLIEQAEHLLRDTPPTQANIRRAVSSAYYGLFHLLIRDAVLNWRQPDLHDRLARAFDHRRMKEASSTLLRELGSPQRTAVPESDHPHRASLSRVARAFVELQDARHKADYDVGEEFEPAEASNAVEQARQAFAAWMEVREESIAQPYLYSLLFRERV